MPVISFLLIGIFSFVNLAGNVFADKNGGGFFVGSNTTFNFNATISGSSATNGGGVYIANGGTFNMNGGAIYGNTATTTGNNIYNAGTFNMTGGTVGISGTSSSGYGIYNTGTMNLYGGHVYDKVYTATSINTKMACNIQGTITLGDSATITLQDYAGTTPNYTINLSNARTAGTILTFVGSSTEPDLTKLNISGYDTNAFEIVSEKNSSGNWTVILQEPVKEYDFPSDWKTQVASATYMTTTITPTNLTGIQFVKNVPTGFTQIGTLSTGLPVYQGTTSTEIAFVGETIYAPENSASLFASLKKMTLLNTSSYNTSKVTTFNSMFMSCSALTDLDLSGFNTSKVTNMYRMFSGCRALVSLDLENFDTSNVTTMSTMFNVCESLVTLDLSMFNTPKVTTYYYMFSNCSKLETIDVSNFNTSNATNMGSMFTNCKSLKTLDLSSFNMVKVTTYSNMFNFGSSNYITLLKTPYNNKNELPITTGSVLFNAETGDSVVSVPANTSESLTYTNESQNKYFPAVWKDEIESTTYMTATITPSNLTSIQFVSSVPSGFTQIGTLSTGIKVYQSSNTKIAFVNSKTIYAPNDCSSLFDSLRSVTSIIFDNFSTSEVTNMKSMFYNCYNLKSLNLSGFDTTNVQDMSSMFYGCSSLASLNTSNFNTLKVTNMSDMFNGCSILTSLDINNFDTSKVTDISSMFCWCEKLTSLDVSSFNTSNVTDMSGMFSWCLKLTSLDVSNLNTSKVTNMGTIFYGCSGLTNLNLSNFDTSKVTNMSSMFYDCSNITSLDLSGFITSNVTTMYYMFADCSGLKTLNLSNFDTSTVKNMSGMFSGCSNLISLDLSSFDMTNAETYNYMLDFGSTGKLKTLKTPYNNKSALSITTGSTLYNVETGAVVTSVPANTTKSLTYTNVPPSKIFPTTWKTEIASTTYMTTTLTPANLTSIKFVATVPSGYTKIGTLSTGVEVYKGSTATEIAFVGKSIKAPSPYNSRNLFENLSALTSINFSAFSTSNVTDMSCMFKGCNNLTNLDLSNFDTTKVTNMNSMFQQCESLISLNLSNFNTSNVTTMYRMFNNCSALTNLNVSNFNTSKVTNMSGMFSSCSNLTSIVLSNFDTSNVVSMDQMFVGCSTLKSLDLSNFDTLNVTDMSAMFQSCNALTSLDLSTFNMSKVISVTYMLNFGSTDKLKELKTPYNNTTSIPIKTGSTLYNVETGAVVTSVPANTTASKTYATQLTLTFDANGGTCNTTSATAYYNVSLRDSGFVFPYPTKSGYMFSGWYQNTSFVGTKLSLDSVFTTNCKFYAKWEDQNPPSGGGSSNNPCYIGWEETGRPLVNEVSEDIKRYNNNYTLESIDGFVIISEYNSSSFQDYTLVERLNISHLPVQIYIVELNPEGPNASYINCSNCLLIVAIYVEEYAFGISNTWEGVVFDENEQLFRELAPNAIFWDLRGFCTENFKPEYNEYGELTTEQYKLILGRQVQLCILPENFYLGIDWSLSEAGCVVQNYLFEDVTGDYSFVSSKNNDQNEICRDIGIAKISLNFNQEKTIQNILNLNDEKLLETKRKIKLVSNVKKE